MSKHHVNNAITALECTGCEACANICPVKAISMRPDERGFRHPYVDDGVCISCGKCVAACPVFGRDRRASLEPVEHVYAAYSKNKETRYMSTSGGMFTELATNVLQAGGVVFGAAYGKDNAIFHTCVESADDLPKLRQSKYAQSDKGDSYAAAKKYLEAGRTVMFSAAPCEIAALKSIVGNPGNLITVDFLCLGCNSPMVYRKYLESLEREADSRATRVWFKNKELGWNRFSTRVDFENGTQYRKDRETDGFMRGYIVHPLYVRPCCEHCLFKGTPHDSDITLGDFWGVEDVIPGIDSSHGVSVVFVNTRRGSKLFERVISSLECHEVSFEEALTPANMNALLNCVKRDSRSNRFYKDLQVHGFAYAIRRNASDALLVRCRNKIRSVLRKGER